MKHWISLRTVSTLASLMVPAALIALAPGPVLALSASSVPSSPLYAGWIVSSAPAKASVSATFNVPAITCTSADTSFYPGIEIPDATGVVGLGLYAGCQGGKPFYDAAGDRHGQDGVYFAVQSGDTIVVSLTSSTSKATGTLQDTTDGQTYDFTSVSGAAPLQPRIGDDSSEQSPSDNPVPNFRKVTFTACTMDGKTIKAAKAVRQNMATSSGSLQITTGTLNSAGNQFTTTFVNSGTGRIR